MNSGTSMFMKAVNWAVLILIPVILMAGIYNRQQSSCEEPLTYRIGTVDGRFGMSSDQVSLAVREAASVWSRAAGRELFREDPKGAIEIRLVYDFRQAAADRLKSLSGKIDNTRGSHEFLKQRFETLKAEYEQQKADLSRDIDAYNSRMNALKAQVDTVNRAGNVTEEVVRQLNAERDAQEERREELQIRQEELRQSADTLNSMVVVINEIAYNLNLDVLDYNNTGRPLRREFNEGLYELRKGHETITVYHFSSKDRLLKVLSHELGHALGLQHNENPGSIMYRLNQSDSLDPAAEDLQGLRQRCGR